MPGKAPGLPLPLPLPGGGEPLVAGTWPRLPIGGVGV
jgi:hypothetical protein